MQDLCQAKIFSKMWDFSQICLYLWQFSGCKLRTQTKFVNQQGSKLEIGYFD